jgi:hypothetical protein
MATQVCWGGGGRDFSLLFASVCSGTINNAMQPCDLNPDVHEAHLFGGSGLRGRWVRGSMMMVCMHFCHLHSTCIILAYPMLRFHSPIFY